MGTGADGPVDVVADPLDEWRALDLGGDEGVDRRGPIDADVTACDRDRESGRMDQPFELVEGAAGEVRRPSARLQSCPDQ